MGYWQDRIRVGTMCQYVCSIDANVSRVGVGKAVSEVSECCE